MDSPTQFRVAIPADCYDSEGRLRYRDMGLGVLEGHPGIESVVLDEARPELGSDQLNGIQGAIVLGARVTPETVSAADDLLVFSRVGVGYDTVDVPACTNADVLVLITVGAVDRPVAEATVGWMIALTHNMRTKDRLVRTGEWEVRTQYHGVELRERTFGTVGLGGIARETIRLLSIFGMNPPLAYDPYLAAAAAAELGVELVGLDDLMARADFVSVHCPLSEGTRGLIGAHELSLMKPDAYLINTARGGIVDEDALYAALEKGDIAGAALDCFVGEPVTEPHRFGKLENTLLAPHAIAWTDELFRDIGSMSCQGVVDLAQGRQPRGAVNPDVFDRPGFQEKWERLRVGG